MAENMTSDEESSSSNPGGKISDSIDISPKVSTSTQKIVIWVLFGLVISLLVIAFTTFILLLQKQSEISRNSKVAGYPAGHYNGMNWQTSSEKMVAALVQEKLNKTMQDVLHERALNATQLIKDMVPIPDTQQLLLRMSVLLSNMTSSVLQNLREQLGISHKSLEDLILKDLGNLSDTVLNRLKEELEIDPAHFYMAVHRAVERSTKNKLALIRGKCELLHNEICYFLLKTGPVRYGSAKYFCERQDAKAANIYNNDHYRVVIDFLRRKMLPMDSLWLGMTRNSMNGTIYLENGEKSAFAIPWALGYPQPFNLTVSHLALKLTYNATSTEQGFFNELASQRQLGVLCEL